MYSQFSQPLSIRPSLSHLKVMSKFSRLITSLAAVRWAVVTDWQLCTSSCCSPLSRSSSCSKQSPGREWHCSTCTTHVIAPQQIGGYEDQFGYFMANPRTRFVGRFLTSRWICAADRQPHEPLRHIWI